MELGNDVKISTMLKKNADSKIAGFKILNLFLWNKIAKKYGILKVINSKEETNLSNQTKYFWYDSFTTKFCFIERLGCIGTIQCGTDCMLVSQFGVPLGFLNVRLPT